MIAQRYPEPFIAPMRDELARLGFDDLRTPDAVDAAVTAAGHDDDRRELGVRLRGRQGASRHRAVAAQRQEAPTTSRRCLREPTSKPPRPRAGYFAPYPPSSPSIGLMKDGKLVYLMERKDIEIRSSDMIAAELQAAFEKFC